MTEVPLSILRGIGSAGGWGGLVDDRDTPSDPILYRIGSECAIPEVKLALEILFLNAGKHLYKMVCPSVPGFQQATPQQPHRVSGIRTCLIALQFFI